MLSEEQEQALNLFEKGHNIFISGVAGCGKSFFLSHLQSLGIEGLYTTATTGIAASLINGTTIHSFSGIGLGLESSKELVKKVRRSSKRLNWIKCNVLIIDE